jgi:hypothetical protein
VFSVETSDGFGGTTLMAKAELKTRETGASVEDFIKGIGDEQQRADSLEIARMMEKATGEKAKMWGPSIIGFGSRTLKYSSGRELDWMKIGFSPRKAAITFYLLGGIKDGQLQALGKYKTGKGCLYVKRLSDINTSVLQQLIDASLKNASDKGRID